MRALPFLLSTALASLPAALLPTATLAETFQLTSQISNVIVYPNGAKVTRTAQFDLPAGSHQLQVLDLPQTVALDGIRAKLTGAQLGAVTLRDDFVPPAPRSKMPPAPPPNAALKPRVRSYRPIRMTSAACSSAKKPRTPPSGSCAV